MFYRQDEEEEIEVYVDDEDEEEEDVWEDDNVREEEKQSVGNKRLRAPSKRKGRKEGGRKSKKHLHELKAAKPLETAASKTVGDARSSKQTGGSRKNIWKKFKTAFSIQAGDIADVKNLDASFFTDEKLALFLILYGQSMDYGQSAMKAANAALGDWLHQRGQPKYFDRPDMYPQVVDALKVCVIVVSSVIRMMTAILKCIYVNIIMIIIFIIIIIIVIIIIITIIIIIIIIIIMLIGRHHKQER